VRFAGGEYDEHPNGRFVSSNYFSVLGVAAERGRLFTEHAAVCAFVAALVLAVRASRVSPALALAQE
jgi:hypothetical protein